MIVMQNCTLFTAAVVSLITAATALLLQLIMLANNNETNETLLLFKAKTENRFIALETQNRNHDEEMEVLKIENLEMRSKINQMNKQLNSDNGPKSSGFTFETFIGDSTNKPKRPARLLPLQLIS